MQLPTITIVIPTKNEEQSLPRVLQALRQQTVQPKEIIVADAQSTDSTRDVAASFGVRVVDGGLPGPGRNRGAEVATADVLLFLDADVTIDDPQFIEKALSELVARKLEVATADIYLINGSRAEHFGHAFYNWYVRLWGAKHPHTPGFCLFITRKLFEAVKGFDETVVFCEDHDLGLRAGKRGAFGFLDSVRIGLNDRRLRKEGGLVTAVKYILAEFHIFLLGPIRHNLFRYGFDYNKPQKGA